MHCRGCWPSSPGEPRLRAGWRLLIQTLFLLLIGGCLSVFLLMILLALDPALLTSMIELSEFTTRE